MSVLPLFMKKLSSSFTDMQLLFLISLLLTVVSLAFLIMRGELNGVLQVTFSKTHIGFLVLFVAFLMFLDTFKSFYVLCIDWYTWLSVPIRRGLSHNKTRFIAQ